MCKKDLLCLLLHIHEKTSHIISYILASKKRQQIISVVQVRLWILQSHYLQYCFWPRTYKSFMYNSNSFSMSLPALLHFNGEPCISIVFPVDQTFESLRFQKHIRAPLIDRLWMVLHLCKSRWRWSAMTPVKFLNISFQFSVFSWWLWNSFGVSTS